MAVNPIPEDFHTLSPYLLVPDATAAVEFYQRAFEAQPGECMRDPGGEVMHAELRIGDSHVMVGSHEVPQPEGPPPVSLYMYVQDADEVARRAVAAGATELYPVQKKFYGNREGGVRDPFGITWWIASRVEIVSPEEIERRAAER